MLGAAAITAQAQQPPEGFSNGVITFVNGQTVNGPVQNRLAKKGTFILLTETGKKQTCTAEQVTAVLVGNSRFITIGYEFFEVITEGAAMNLYRKASSAAGQIRYNGNEPVAITGSDGVVGDYFVTLPGNTAPKLISRKNFEQQMGNLCAGCSQVVNDIKEKKLGYEQLKELVGQYNNCNG